MLKTSLTLPALSLIAIGISTSGYANECQGELYGINAGRGDLGLLFSLNEEAQTAQANSVAKFSSSALAFDSTSNRMYYAASPRPTEYEVDISGLAISADELAHLPIKGKKYRTTKLAYYDFTSQSHTTVGTTKSVIGMVYDSQNDVLLANSYSKLYQINKETGEATELASLGSVSGKYRGDLVIKDSKLLLVTSSSTYEINRSNYSLSLLSSHGLTSVTGATLNQAGDVMISRTLINDHGHANKSQLYVLEPSTGSTCLVATVPVRLNDLATNTNQPVACYTNVQCGTVPKPTFSLQPVTDSVVEGGTLTYSATISATFNEDITVALSVTDGTTSPSDYTLTTSTVTIPAGQTSATVTIQTIDNDVHSADKTLTVNATAQTGVTGQSSAGGTIINDDEACTPQNYTRINYQFVSESSLHDNDWGVKVNGSYVKLLDEYGASGSYDVLQSSSITYVLAIKGNSNQLTTNMRQSGNVQYWEDENDSDYNDFAVRVTTQTVQKGCN
ncbi:hemolysin [Pseudoalteromonas citrea]|uniref:Hemolysin n=1 Tax=Pseudoalteromonas citrea TaxID=43655 RepID=A0A5S3XNT1_9GAMM|nr:Calx-beta domain-containing protein [Pseudoalteromonas citrea]TMP44639.1 hemolysin [Pseudoalteromonas citrea]TMP55830.1 hemolysin [Pseudoalteromonas citrea]